MNEKTEEESIVEFPRLRALQGGKTYDPPDLDWLSPMIKAQCFLCKEKNSKAKLRIFQIIHKEEKDKVVAFCLKSGDDGSFTWVDPEEFCKQFTLYLDMGVTSD